MGSHTLAVLHDPQDGVIGLLHALLCQHAYIGNGIVNGACYDAFATAEFLVMEVHPIAHDTCIYCRGDLSGAGRLGTVTDGAGQDGNGIDDGVGNGTITAP